MYSNSRVLKNMERIQNYFKKNSYVNMFTGEQASLH